MAYGTVSLPPISEILGDVPRHADGHAPHQSHNGTAPRQTHPFADAQSLAPSLGRPPFRSHAGYPGEAAAAPEYSDRRGSYGSGASSAAVTPANGSPGPHVTAGGSNRGLGGLPPLYGPVDMHPQQRSGPPAPHHAAYAPTYNGYAAPGYAGQYGPDPGQGVSLPAPPYSVGFEHMEYPDGKTKRRRGNLPKHVTDILRQWFQEHVAHPYPTEEEKQTLMRTTGLSMSQISNWFINARRRSIPANQTPQPKSDSQSPR